MPQIDLHILMLTVVHDIMQRCWTKTIVTVRIFNTACREYHSCLTVEGDAIKNLFANRKPYYMEANSIKYIRAKHFDKRFSTNAMPREDLHKVSPMAFDVM